LNFCPQYGHANQLASVSFPHPGQKPFCAAGAPQLGQNLKSPCKFALQF
jgi:hypothetical protein